MPRKQPKLDYGFICDDIREEVGNKLTLVGLYQDNIFVPKLPFVFPKLCVLAQVTGISKDDRFSVQFEDPDQKKLGKEITFAIPAQQKGEKLRIVGIFSPLKVEKEGTYTLTITINDDQETKVNLSFVIKKRRPEKLGA
jgi:hypothetical protein